MLGKKKSGREEVKKQKYTKVGFVHEREWQPTNQYLK